jgi:hypothetical protein
VRKLPERNISCWLLSDQEIDQVGATGVIWVTNQTFSELKPHPAGERYQPALSVTADKEIAFLISRERDGLQVPASDRIVRYDDNRPAFDEAREAVAALSASLSSGNDVGNLTDEDVLLARQELQILQHALACESIRTAWLFSVSRKTLLWIGGAAAGTIVGQLALNALARIGVVLG